MVSIQVTVRIKQNKHTWLNIFVQVIPVAQFRHRLSSERNYITNLQILTIYFDWTASYAIILKVKFDKNIRKSRFDLSYACHFLISVKTECS